MTITGLTNRTRKLVVAAERLMIHPCTLATTTASPPPVLTTRVLFPRSPSLNLRHSTTLNFTTMNTAATHLDTIFNQKKILRSKVRKDLKSMDPSLRSQEDDHSQVSKKLYVPRVEDKNSHMRMLNISRMNDLIANSMDILEPAPVDAEGNERKDVMFADEPVDLFLLPGLAFDKTGRRLGRGGGYYDTFLTKYQELAKDRNWKRPLFVALSYSLQLLDDNVIPVTPNDVLVDALVTSSGVIPISSAAREMDS
ncbi:5-formyltetrahydrofolate cyclo-ligase [Forsythia ovata]|uniref:5-formyltetrahydrofolate cyclo-ligase n=1 Tax=Forsythia ovata TaxID=205694 RepID=A0ABD1P6B7_9LAMI